MAQLAGVGSVLIEDLGSSPRSEQFQYCFSILIPMQRQY